MTDLANRKNPAAGKELLIRGDCFFVLASRGGLKARERPIHLFSELGCVSGCITLDGFTTPYDPEDILSWKHGSRSTWKRDLHFVPAVEEHHVAPKSVPTFLDHDIGCLSLRRVTIGVEVDSLDLLFQDFFGASVHDELDRATSKLEDLPFLGRAVLEMHGVICVQRPGAR